MLSEQLGCPFFVQKGSLKCFSNSLKRTVGEFMEFLRRDSVLSKLKRVISSPFFREKNECGFDDKECDFETGTLAALEVVLSGD